MKTEKLISYLRSGFPCFWLRTHEPNRVRSEVYAMLKDFVRKDGEKYSIAEWTCTKNPNPLEALNGLAQAPDLTVLFAYNFHWFGDKPQVVQTIQDNIPLWSNGGKALVVVSPSEKIPFELQKDFVLLDLPLPEEKEILSAIKHIAPKEDIIPQEKGLQRLISACKGLTRAELESVLALSFVETEGKEFSIPVINQHKAMAIAKTGFLEVIKPTVTFNDIIGYNIYKDHILTTHDHPKAKGNISIGPPGCGKTSITKAIVAETGRFGVAVNMGRLFSKYQGETDQNINTVISLIEALGDCFVLIDEFEKQFAGASSDGSLDSGTTRRATGRWLDFLQNRPSGIYICATANSFNGIPDEYLRPGRWDSSPFYIDLPSAATRKKILELYVNKADMKMPKKIPNMEHFSGAEIEAMVHMAEMKGIELEQAAKSIIPQAKNASESIKRLREWAKLHAQPAEEDMPVKLNGKRKMDVGF